MVCKSKKCPVFYWSALTIEFVVEHKNDFFEKKAQHFSDEEKLNQIALSIGNFLLMGRHEVDHEIKEKVVKIKCKKCKILVKFLLKMS